jgi:hypothetical protein
MKNFLAMLILLYVPNISASLVVQSSNDLDQILTQLGIFNHPDINVTYAEVKYGSGNGKITSELSAVYNSTMTFALTNYNEEVVLVSAASSGKKQGEPGFVAPSSIGTFANSTGIYGLPNNGIVLSTGNVLDYSQGPNTTGSKTTNWGNSGTVEQEGMLSQISGSGSSFFDVTQINITFDVINNLDTLSFLAAFGSEEYASYQGTAYNDGFGLFLNGQNFAASVPAGESLAQTINISHPDMVNINGTELDGVIKSNNSTTLRLATAVTPDSTDNVLTIIIGDRADQLFDSTVFLSLEENITSSIPASNGDPLPSGEYDFGVPFGSENLMPAPVVLTSVASSGKKYKSSGSKFQSIAMPSLNTINDGDGFALWVWNGAAFNFEKTLLANEIFDFTSINVDGIEQFMIYDIDPTTPLDLNDPRAFMIGANFMGEISVSDLTISLVSTPTTLSMFLLGVFLLKLKSLRKISVTYSLPLHYFLSSRTTRCKLALSAD